MIRVIPALVLLAAVGLCQAANRPGFLLFLSEVRVGGMVSDHRCTLIFPDRRFHHEVATLKHGREFSRKVYEGELSEGSWNELAGVLEDKRFKGLAVPRTLSPAVMEDSHVYTISVARDGKFQNMEFLNDKGRKPYDAELKPLLQWWKSFTHQHLTESQAAADSQCSLNAASAVFSQ